MPSHTKAERKKRKKEKKSGFSLLTSLFGGLTGEAVKRKNERQSRLDALEEAAGTKSRKKKKR